MEGIGHAAALGGAQIGPLALAQIALGALGPDRPGRGGSEVAQQLGLLLQRPVARLGFGEFPGAVRRVRESSQWPGHRWRGPSPRWRRPVEVERWRQKAFAGLA